MTVYASPPLCLSRPSKHELGCELFFGLWRKFSVFEARVLCSRAFGLSSKFLRSERWRSSSSFFRALLETQQKQPESPDFGVYAFVPVSSKSTRTHGDLFALLVLCTASMPSARQKNPILSVRRDPVLQRITPQICCLEKWFRGRKTTYESLLVSRKNLTEGQATFVDDRMVCTCFCVE